MTTANAAMAGRRYNSQRSTFGGNRWGALTLRVYSSGGFASTNRRFSRMPVGVLGPNRCKSTVSESRAARKRLCTSGATQAPRAYETAPTEIPTATAVRTRRRECPNTPTSATPPAKIRNGRASAASSVTPHAHRRELADHSYGGCLSSKSGFPTMKSKHQGHIALATAPIQAVCPRCVSAIVAVMPLCRAAFAVHPSRQSLSISQSGKSQQQP